MAKKLSDIWCLEGHLRYYLRHVIGRLDYELLDSSQPAILWSQDGKPARIALPLSIVNLCEFLGARFVQVASRELLLSIGIALLYHEVAHDLSGESHTTEPRMLNNLICDANDVGVVPRLFPGSIPFTLALHRVTFEMGFDAQEAGKAQSKKEKLEVLLLLSVAFLRRLRVKHHGKEVRSLPRGVNPLFEVFEDNLKPIMRKARKCHVPERPELVKELHEALKEWWEDEKKDASDSGQGNTRKSAQAGTGSLEKALAEIGDDPKQLDKKNASRLSAEDAQRMASDAAMAEVLRQASAIMKESEKQQQADQNSAPEKGKGGGISTKSVVPFELKEMEDLPPEYETVAVDQALAAEVRIALQPLIFERALKRRAPAVVGRRFAPSRFYEIKTNPDAPSVRKDVIRHGRAINEALVVLCFDRSGSMSSDDKEVVAKQICATMYYALSLIPRVRVILLGFNQAPELIKPSLPRLLSTILRRIAKALSSDGGTNFAIAFQESVRLAKETEAHRRLVVMLTDGDIGGKPAPTQTLQVAQQEGIDVVCIGVQGASMTHLQAIFGPNALSVPDVRRLPEEIRKVVVDRTVG